MFGLMIGLGFLGMMLSRGGDVGPAIPQGGRWPGMRGMGPFGLIFPGIGPVMMLLMMFFFFRRMTGGGGLMSGMMGHHYDPQSQSQVSRDEPQNTCPSCESPFQADWKVCPHCGQEFKAVI